MMNTLKTSLCSILANLSLISSASASPISEIQSTIFYSMPGSTGNCFNWSSACQVRTSLSAATNGDHIWFASGTQKPTANTHSSIFFALKSGVSVYGDFPVACKTWEHRDPWKNIITLSGNIGDGENNLDNNYHMANGSSVMWVHMNLDLL